MAPVIASVHIAELGPRTALPLSRARLHSAPGLRHAELAHGAKLGASVIPAPLLGRAMLIAVWEDDAALDRFLAEHPIARRFAGGWHARLQPLRISGAWPEVPEIVPAPLPVQDHEPVVVLTIGHLRLRRALPFLRASAAAEGQAVADPATLAATGFTRLPRFVGTCSVWRTAREMRDYAYGASGAAHKAAIDAHRARSFHHASAFIRLRPYASAGSWEGRDPLAVPAAAG